MQKLKESAQVRRTPDDAWDYVLPAMIQHQLGNAAEAKQLLEQTAKWLEANKEKLAKEWPWTERLEVQLLRREAEKLIGDGK